MKPSFSVILPFYNAAATLQETLGSIANQSYRSFEIIAINDGSSDNSSDILKKWHRKNQGLPLKVIHQENKGLGAARNKAIAEARSEWVALLDADDLWKPDKLKETAAAIERFPADIYYHSVESFGTGFRRKRKAYPLHSMEELLKRGNPIIPSAVAGKTATLKKFPFTEDRGQVEDLPVWIELLNQKHIFYFFDKPLTCYRETGGISTDLEDHLKKVFSVLEKFYGRGYFSKTELTFAKRRKYFEAGRFYHKRGLFEKANYFYSLADFKSLQLTGLRFLSYLGLRL